MLPVKIQFQKNSHAHRVSMKVTNCTVQHKQLLPRCVWQSQAQATNLPPSLTEDHTATAYSCTHTVAAVRSFHQSS